MKAKMLGDQVLIRRAAGNEKTPGGIYVPQTTQDNEAVAEGVVIGAGPGFYAGDHLEPLTVKEGDKVLFRRGVGMEVKLNGEKLLVVNEVHILCVLVSEE